MNGPRTAMSHRTEQLESTLRRTIGQIITEGLSDPRLRGIVSVTNVKVTDDKHTAVVDVSVMPEAFEKGTIQALRHAAKHIRHEVSQRVEARTLPFLDFKIDRSLKQQARVMDAINDAMSVTQTDASDEARQSPEDGDNT